MKKKGKQKNYFAWFLFFLVIILLLFLAFNSNGFFEYWKAVKRNENLTLQIQKAEEKIRKTELLIDSLKSSNKKIEQIAREKYNMLKPNEEVLKVERK